MNKVYDSHMTNEIKFHHLINSGDEKGAIKLLKECGNSFNVNYEYKSRVPIFSAINNRMYDLCDEIVSHPMFDCGIEDGFGETLLHLLLYLRGTDEIPITENDTASLDRMIKTILNNKKYDFNLTDINHDTVINVACMYPNEIWVVKELISNPSVDINAIDDLNLTALTNAIRNDNIDAIKLLSKRKDLIVRDEDIELAKEEGIDLTEFGFEIAEKFKKAHEYAMA